MSASDDMKFDALVPYGTHMHATALADDRPLTLPVSGDAPLRGAFAWQVMVAEAKCRRKGVAAEALMLLMAYAVGTLVRARPNH